jgi:ATPase subunit of ABC transporter with duplicated ATPase domains
VISIQNLGKSFGARTLFEGATMQLNAGSRYGLVGANGSGKSTLMRILCGDEPATDGSFNLASKARMSVLRQDRFLDDTARILDLAMMGDATVWQAMQEQKTLGEQAEPDGDRLLAVEDAIRLNDGYTLEARASAILVGLGIATGIHREPLSVLSGGFKLRVLLAQVLLGGPDILLLDEPTNHLDILSIRWLEQFLATYKGCAVVISHDQRFLDNVATAILDVDYATVTLYHGNFTRFLDQKAATRAQKEAEIARAEKVIAEKRAFVERFGAKATKAKQAQSRLKQIERIEVEELADTSRRTPVFRFVPKRPSGKEVLTIDAVSKAYGEKKVLKGVSFTVRKGEKVGIIGPNGLGKSTLLKIATGHAKADDGRIGWGHETHVGYFAQEHRELLTDPALTPLDYAWEADRLATTTAVRGKLGQVLFSGDEVTKPVGKLSGGEAARLVFCRLMMEEPNVLVLDEPTNHLDMESISALAEALQRFEGTILFVSHDRWFVSQLATRILELRPDGYQDFPGTYTEYLARSGDDHLDAKTAVLKAKAEAKAKETNSSETEATKSKGAAGAKSTSPELSWEEQKRRNNRLKQLPALRDKALQVVEQAEAKKAEIHLRYATPGFFEKTPEAELAKIKQEEEALDQTIANQMAEWERLEAEIAASVTP